MQDFAALEMKVCETRECTPMAARPLWSSNFPKVVDSNQHPPRLDYQANHDTETPTGAPGHLDDITCGGATTLGVDIDLI